MLAIVFGCERFHTYLFGQSFVVESDHKPLESIHPKHLSGAPARLRRMLLPLQPYSFCIRYRPGPQVPIADVLSRIPSSDSDEVPEMEVQIHDITANFSDELLQRLKLETSKDAKSSTSCKM